MEYAEHYSIGFNSKLVRLKAEVEVALRNSWQLRFNSKLVRLKVDNPITYLDTRKFQFQIGAIKR